MKRYKPYSAYRDSGVDWLGRVPVSWNISLAKRNFDFGMGETILSDDLVESGIPVMSATENDIVFGYVADAKKVLDVGDIIIPARGNSIGSVKIVSRRCSTTQTTIYGKTRGSMNVRYVWYFMLGFRDLLFFFDRTAIPQITVQQVGDGILLKPSLVEQEKIAAYLDRETARIDALISKKTRFIQLLREKRQALITHAVTKGLDPNVKMKDSGVEWLGEVPEHWTISPVKYYFSFGMGQTILAESLTETGVPVMSATEGNAIFGYIENPRLVLDKNDLIIPARGNSIGSVKLVSEKCTTTQTTIYGRSLGKMDSRFVVFYMLAFRDVLFFFDRTAIPQITVEQVGEGEIPWPSVVEQSEISDFIDREASRIEALILKSERSINLLKERRSALITAAVTGEIDLRS